MTDEQRSQTGCIGVQESVVILARVLSSFIVDAYTESYHGRRDYQRGLRNRALDEETGIV